MNFFEHAPIIKSAWLFCTFFLFIHEGAFCQMEPMREWEDVGGRKLKADLKGFEAGDVIFATSDGKSVRVPLSRLSPKHQVEAIFAIQSVAVASTRSGPSVDETVRGMIGGLGQASKPVFSTAWPAFLTATSFTKARYLEKESKPLQHMYVTKNFQYTAFTSAPFSERLMEDVARVFEGTHMLLSRSPFGVQAVPLDGYYRAEIYPDFDAYHSAGGPQGSAGVYRTRDKKFMLPVDSLGLKVGRADEYVKASDFEVKTLVHELTHMMMHDILPLIPQWLVEGSAEYTECIPYRDGVFLHSSIHTSVKKYNESRFKRRLMGPATMDMASLLSAPATKPVVAAGLSAPPQASTSAVPDPALYHTGLLLTYYFMHLDGDKKGTRLQNYLNAVRAEKPRFDEYVAAFARYRVEMDDFLKKPGVKKLDGGRFEYASDLVPPEPPKPPAAEYEDDRLAWLHIGLLLDGRTPEAVAIEAEKALVRAGLLAR
jgi:hypothetical protein